MGLFDFLFDLFNKTQNAEMSPAEPFVKPQPFSGEVNGNRIDGWVYVPGRTKIGNIPNDNHGVIVLHGGWFGGLVPTYAPYVNAGMTTVYLNFEGEPDLTKQDPTRDVYEVNDAGILLKRLYPNLKYVDLVGVSLGCYRALRAFAFDGRNIFRRVVGMIGPINMHDASNPVDWSSFDAATAEQVREYFSKAQDPKQLAELGYYDGNTRRILLLYGEKDRICPPKTMLLPFLRRARCYAHIVEGAAHNVHRTVEGQKLTVQFLKRLFVS